MAYASADLPTYEELKVPQDINLSSPALKASAVHMHLYCEPQCKEYMLCRREMMDPRKCLKEGKEVTACGVEFLRRVKRSCRQQFDTYAKCVDDTYQGGTDTTHCRAPERAWDDCVHTHFDGQTRPMRGYFARPHVHHTERPPPPTYQRDYVKEAAEMRRVDKLPDDVEPKKDFTRNTVGSPFDGFIA